MGKENAGNVVKVFFSHLNELLPPPSKLSVDAAPQGNVAPVHPKDPWLTSGRG